MRPCLRSLALVLALLPALLLTPAPAHADILEVSLSVVGTGNIGPDFTNALVTVTDRFTYVPGATCYSNPPSFCDSAADYMINNGGTSSVTVAGIGTYTNIPPVLLLDSSGVNLAEAGGHSSLIVVFPASNQAPSALLPGVYTGLIDQTLFGDSCFNYTEAMYCPARYGPLSFESSASTATVTVRILPDSSPVPEPQTWLMVGTGMIGAAYSLRQRFKP